MPTIYENQLGVTAGGYTYTDVITNRTSEYNNTIYASQVIESPERRFITDSERYALAQLQNNAMLKNTYDPDKDGIVDHAAFADKTETADNATHAINADTSEHAINADNAVNAEHAINADNAAKAEEAVNAEHAANAANADHALKADEALKADAVEWDNILNKPDNFVTNENLTWDNIKETAPEVISDTARLENRLGNLEENNHAHINMEALKLLTVDANNQPVWNNEKWPGTDGDMRREVYDTDGDGVVDKAKTVNYEDITNLPTKFAPDEHTHDAFEVTQDSTHRFVSDIMIDTWNAKQNAIPYTPENVSNKGANNGYAPLDSEGYVPERHVRGIQWESLANKPESSVTDIDNAVNKAHNHINLAALDKLSQNPEGIPIWDNKAWPYPGDMRKADYDSDEDGIIDRAYQADNTTWSGITGKPVSTVADIDDTVNKKHVHSNVSALALLDVDNQQMPIWNNEVWPYDMKRSIYDTDNDGVVDEAVLARNVRWNGILNKPASDVADIDDAVSKKHEHENISALTSVSVNDTSDRLTFKGKELAFKEDTAVVNTPNGDIQGKHSVEVDTSDSKLHLVGDQAFPEANSYYGTDGDMNRGFFKLPEQSKYKGINSLVIDNADNICLKNDSPTPAAKSYYGTDENGVLGYHVLPSNDNTSPAEGSIAANLIAQDDTHRFVTKELLEKLEGIDTGSSSDTTTSTEDVDTITGPSALAGTRQCILSAPDNFFALNGSDLAINATENTPIIASFSAGRDSEIIKIIKTNLSVTNLPSAISDGTAYVYLYIDTDGSVKANKTSLKPIYSYTMPTEKENGRYWFNISTYTMYISNGTNYVAAEHPTLFIGEVEAVSGRVAKSPYAIGAVYDSGWYSVSYGTTYNMNHNMGTDILYIAAYRGTNGVNMGEFAFALHGSGAEAVPVGDRITKVTENAIQTSRYSMVNYSDVLYGTTNQHRVLVRRGW